MIPQGQGCIFCTGDASAPDHALHCDGRQGLIEERIEQAMRARAERDEVLDRVEASVGEDFLAQAEAFALVYLRDWPQGLPAECLTNACKAAGIVPRDDRAFGPVYMRLARAGRIEKAGACSRTKGHGTAGGNLWRLVQERRS